MWNKLRSFLGIKDPVPRYVVVKWKMGDRWAIKDIENNMFKSLTSNGCWWYETDPFFNPCCTSSNKAEIEELCMLMNNSGTLWEEEKQ